MRGRFQSSYKQRTLRAQRAMLIVKLNSSRPAIAQNAQLRIAKRAAFFLIRDTGFAERPGGMLLRSFRSVRGADHYTSRECPKKEAGKQYGYEAAQC